MEETYIGESIFSYDVSEIPESQSKEVGSTDYENTCTNYEVPQCAELGSDPGKLDPQEIFTKCSTKLARYGKKVAKRNRDKSYPLTSSVRGTRVLRSMSKNAHVTCPPTKNIPVNPVKRKSKTSQKAQRTSNDEFSRVKRTVRYLLHRMRYEHSLIDAYAGEGWKGQSAEKIKPEMELQRAKSEILRCKLKIRNLFQQLDSSISEGKLDGSLFDAGGGISSEDIFCAKCRSKDVTLDNDIILCDGMCSRGFHQNCLDPPLLKDEIPPGDESWLCPVCDCKADCLGLINETQDSDLSIEDQWEKVFPEASVFTSKSAQDDDLELPSDDSEDYDYDPDHLQADEEAKEGSSSNESDFSSASEDLENHDLHDQNFGFPSDDSEDDDYDPEKPDLDEEAAEGNLGSDGSDFTSDTDDLNATNDHVLEAGETSVSPMSSYPSSFRQLGKSDAGVANMSLINSVFCSLESELGRGNAVQVSVKRQRERMNYNKLYDEASLKELSDPSDDREWMGTFPLNNLTVDTFQEETERSAENHVENVGKQRNLKSIEGRLVLQNTTMHSVSADVKEKENNQVARKHGEVQSGVEDNLVDEINQDATQSYSSEKTPRSYWKYGTVRFQKLQESFRENQYPSRDRKESLARELGMTSRQVNKWFENARRKSRTPATAAAAPGALGATRRTVESGGEGGRSGGWLNRVDVSEIRRDGEKGGGGRKMERTVQEVSSSREMLLMRELRKRRLSK